jgi:CHAT domain-containing protein
MTMNNLATAYSDLPTGDRGENLKKAIICYESAIRIREQMKLYKDLKDSWYNLTLLYSETMSPPDIAHSYKACENCVSALEKEREMAVSEETKSAQAESNAHIYRRMVWLCLERAISEKNPIFYDTALIYAESSKSRNLIEKMIKEDLTPSDEVPPELRSRYKDLLLQIRKLQGELRTLSKAGGPAFGEQERQKAGGPESQRAGEPESQKAGKPESQRAGKPESQTRLETDISAHKELEQKKLQLYKDIDDTQKTINETLEEIGKYDKEFPLLVSSKPRNISVKEIEELLPDKSALIEIYPTNKGTVVFIIDGKNSLKDTTVFIESFTGSNLYNIVYKNWLGVYFEYIKDHRAFENIKNWHSAISNIGKILHRELWGVKDRIRGKSIEDVINEMSPERIIIIPQGGLHLLPLHLISSDSRNGYLIDRYEVVYAPSSYIMKLCSGRRGVNAGLKGDRLFAVANPDRSLRFTDDEVRSISKLFKDDMRKELWYESASKDAVCEQMDWGNYLHFSCHGTAFIEGFLEGDMMSAGLILSHNEVLRVADIFSRIRIHQSKLVALSACETGMVKLDEADEYIGLPGAFLFAGSIGVVSALWAVNDLSTSLLMKKFYNYILVDKKSPSCGLRLAQSWLRNLSVKELKEICDSSINQFNKMEKNESIRGLINSYKDLLADLGHNYSDNDRPYEEPYYWSGFFYSGAV